MHRFELGRGNVRPWKRNPCQPLNPTARAPVSKGEGSGGALVEYSESHIRGATADLSPSGCYIESVFPSSLCSSSQSRVSIHLIESQTSRRASDVNPCLLADVNREWRRALDQYAR